MGKRRVDADQRTFFDQYERVKASYFRARDVIDPAKNVALIPFPDGKTRLLAVSHNHFPSGGGFSFFRCLQCDRRAGVLYLVSGAPRCVKCCDAMNIKRRSVWGFGRDERMRAQDQRLDQLIAKLETDKPLRHKPVPSSWQGKAQIAYNTRRLTNTMRRSMIVLRLNQLASQQQASGGLNLTRAYKPRSDAIAVLPELQQAWKARTYERLEQALDLAQCTIIKALESSDRGKQAAAARLMLRTKQGRERGFR